MTSTSAPHLSLAAIAFVLALGPPRPAKADSADEPLRLAVIVANNATFDGSAPSLRYADDDGVRYRELLAPFFDRVELLSTLDDETQARYPRLGATLRPPDRKSVLSALAAANAEIRRQRPRRSELLFVFVGHGGLDDQARGFMFLADGRFTRADLFREVVAGSAADRTHIILDACNAFSMIAGRGAGEERQRALASFLEGNDLESHPTVGVLAATSESRETHEWSRLGAGIFSHQIRSALSGAADVNLDGLLEYSEVAAFVDAANARLEGDKGLSVFAWPPRQDRHAPLLDLRRGRAVRYVVLHPGIGGRLWLERESAERWADLHKAPAEAVALALPSSQRFFLSSEDQELEIAPGDATLWVSELPRRTREVSSRGAVARAFERQLFAVAFSEGYYRGFVGGRAHLLPVARAAQPFFSREPVIQSPAAARESPWRLEAGYLVAPLLVASGLENGGYVRAGLPLGRHLWATLAADGGYSALAPGSAGTGVSQLGLAVGLAWRQPLARALALEVGLELGDSLVAVHGGPADDYDPTVGTARIHAGLEIALLNPLRLRLEVAGAGYLVNLEGRQQPLARVEGRAGLAWVP